MSIRVGNAPVSWGVYNPSPDNPPFAQVLDAIASAGYDGTELGPYGYLPTDPEALRRELAARKLALGSSYVGVRLTDAEGRAAAIEGAMRVARLLASQGVTDLMIADEGDAEKTREAIAGRVPADGSRGFSDAEWRAAAETLHAIARAARSELGMRVVVHHHVGTFIETPSEIERLFAETDPELVGLLLDTGHAIYGGADPLDIVRKHGDRVLYVHLKDVKRDELERVRTTDVHMREAWRRGIFCPLGSGVVDFPRLVEALRSRGYAGWAIVEQDVVPDEQGRLSPEPFESARTSRRYLRDSVGL